MQTRMSTVGAFNSLIAATQKQQSLFSKHAQEIASGHKSINDISDSGQLKNLLNQRSELQINETRIQNLNQQENTLLYKESITSSIFDLATDARNKVLAHNEDSGNSLQVLKEYAKDALNQMQSLLNEEFGGNYIFSGTKTNQAAVDLSKYNIEDSINNQDFDQAFYQGDDQAMILYSQQNYQIKDTVTAREKGFQNIIHGLKIVANAETSTDIKDALPYFNKAIELIPDIRSEIGSDLKSINNKSESLKEQNLLLSQSIEQIQNVDIAESMIKMTQAEIALKATYKAISITERTSLMDYLT